MFRQDAIHQYTSARDAGAKTLMAAPTTFLVVRLSDSFSAEWERLAASAQAGVQETSEPGGMPLPHGPCGIIIAAGGEERRALSIIDQVPGGSPLAVVGAETDHRVVARFVGTRADDYFALPHDFALLRSWMDEHASSAIAEERAAEVQEAVDEAYDFSRILGGCESHRALLRRASAVIPRPDVTVLLLGESGTGKELLAQAIHYNGPRAASPFVAINCAAIPASLLESELFGYEAGAFTGAHTSRAGLFEAAEGGTVFLDEIGDMPLALQAKLLRVLEERRVRRLGSARETPINIRVIAATHQDLGRMVERGEFRRDLFYRLNILPLRLPGLRERGEDVLLLARSFLDSFSKLYETPPQALTPDIEAALLGYSWPGNVRELRNTMERAVLLGEGHLRSEDLFLDAESAGRDSESLLPFPAPLRVIEKAAASAMVERCAGNKSRAADALGISRKHLYALLS